MDYLLAKPKGKDFHKLLSNKQIYTAPDVESNNLKSYTSSYKLEEDEWFKIEKFSKQVYCIDLLKEEHSPIEYNKLISEDYTKIEYLCYVDARGRYYFQRVHKNTVLKKSFIWGGLNNNPSLYVDEPIIMINPQPDAVYDKTTDTLIFRSLPTISTIFKGIEVLFKEATQEETDGFLKREFITLDANFSADKVKTANRKRIAMALETLNAIEPLKQKKIFSYIGSYYKELKYNKKDNTFSLSDEEGLKMLLFGIEERFYTTHVGKVKRIANSVKDLT